MTTLSFDQGTIVLSGLSEAVQLKPTGFIWDERITGWRAEAFRYREIVLWLRKHRIPFIDQARQYDPKGLSLESITSLPLFDYQEQAISAWRQLDQRGIVVLPTGSGKTVVALEAISLANRPALIVVPTLDLLNQSHAWRSRPSA
jgi:superfamily II DNA or RNA helicase